VTSSAEQFQTEIRGRLALRGHNGSSRGALKQRVAGKQEPLRIPVFVVVPPRLLLLDIAGPLEVLRQVNRVQTAVRFDVRYVGPIRSMLTSIGVTLSEIEPLPNKLPANAWVVLAGDVEHVMLHGGGMGHGITREDAAAEERIVEWLKTNIRSEHKLISICTGALIAGRARLLDGHACTTHHSSYDDLRRLAPKAKVLENRLYVEDGQLCSSAGITAGIDLMLHVVSQCTSQPCAVAVARYLVVYLRRTGADPQLSPWLEGRNHIHPAVHRVQDAIAGDITQSWTLHKLAKIAGASGRHLSRLFHEHVGLSIADYRNRLRVAFAQDLLQQTDLDMERVAERSGFGSSRQLRRTWRTLHETPPRDARVRLRS
jgi:transcriptional regulator GlxA family with amidase domain